MTANALLLLKSLGFINRATDARFIECHGGDYVFELSDGSMVAADLVLGSVRVTRV